MTFLPLLLLLSFLVLPCRAQPLPADSLERLMSIHTMVGTDRANTLSAGLFGRGSEEHGQTLPGVLVPNGQNIWTPQTRDTELKCVAPFYYPDTLFQGLRCSHWIVGGCTQDYASFTLAAVSGPLRLSAAERATPFSHQQEQSHPHFYQVLLPRERLSVRVTALSHAAIVQFTALADTVVHIVMQPNSDEAMGSVQVDTLHRRVTLRNPVHRIYQGWGESAGFSGHMVVTYPSRGLVGWGVDSCYAHLSYRLSAGQTLELRAATSMRSAAGAWDNLRCEARDISFQQMQTAAARLWLRRLGAIDVDDDDPAAVTQFYGALYRTLFLPREFSDCGEAQPYYTDFSMWDIYRAQLPLYNLLWPSLSGAFMRSLVAMGQRGGWLPVFPCWDSYTAAMIGDHAAAALADAAVCGVEGFDRQEAYRLMLQNATQSPSERDYLDGKGRRALRSYLRYGYVPLEDSVPHAFHTHEQTSRTLEYAYDDWAVAQMARLLGRTSDYDSLMLRSRNWRHVINPLTGYADGRHADGSWLSCTDVVSRQSFITEGAPCHYTWYVPHDVGALIRHVGRQRFAANLDSMFLEGRYWHGNEPCHQVPYLFNYLAEPEKTARWVRHILRTEYNDTPGGLSGNDDAGQLSAWYVFSSMGFYPVCPASGEYQLGECQFRRVTLHFEDGGSFVITPRFTRRARRTLRLQEMGRGGSSEP